MYRLTCTTGGSSFYHRADVAADRRGPAEVQRVEEVLQRVHVHIHLSLSLYIYIYISKFGGC